MFDLPLRRRNPYRIPLVLVAILAMVWAISGYKVEIHYAAQRGHLFVVRSLVTLNPQSVLSKNGSGDTPLHSAALGGHNEHAIAH